VERKFPNLCTPIEIGDLKIRNRMFSAPMSHPNITAEGLITPEMMNFYELRAIGGSGVVTVSEAVTHFRTGKKPWPQCQS
jgi:2,4-dienoyl-CoA reductase-like NADH-dependent reductase (Old Yellow Enzyme family)